MLIKIIDKYKKVILNIFGKTTIILQYIVNRKEKKRK